MRIYTAVTGFLFALVTVVHVWRMIAESTTLARDPIYLAITATGAALAIWAWRLVRRSPA